MNFNVADLISGFFVLIFIRFIVTTRGGLGIKSLCGNMFYKGYRDFAEKASHHLKASIPLKMYLKSLNSTKNVFKKPRNLLKSLNFYEKCAIIIEIFIKSTHF
jgi:hypothetical protein